MCVESQVGQSGSGRCGNVESARERPKIWYSFVRWSFSSSHIQTVESRHQLNLFLVSHYLCAAAPTRCGPCKDHLKRATKWVESQTFGPALPCVSAPFDQALDSQAPGSSLIQLYTRSVDSLCLDVVYAEVVSTDKSSLPVSCRVQRCTFLEFPKASLPYLHTLFACLPHV
jgi:hypothetical protein